jgi:hypothetical protein
LFSSSIFSLRNRAARTMMISGWVLPNTEAIPAPVYAGLANIAP